MTIKRIFSLLLTVSLLTGTLVMTTSCGLLKANFDLPFFHSDGSTISSDGDTFKRSTIDSTTILEELPEGEVLPIVGNRETLLKLLLERGALYDDSQNMRWGTDDVMYDLAVPESTESVMPAPTADAAPAPAAAPADAGMSGAVEMEQAIVDDSNASFSETNEQVAGVNEGDIVKTDGRYIYAMSLNDNRLRIIKANGVDLEVVSTIDFSGTWGSEFYLIGEDRLAIIGGEHVRIRPQPAVIDEPTSRVVPDIYGWHENSFTTLIIYDISDRTSPNEQRRVSMNGWNLSTRVIGGIVYMITTKHVWGVPISHADSPFILPYSRDTADSTEFEPIDYSRIHYIPGTNDTSYMLVGAIDVYDDAPFEPTAYLGAGSNLYMSRNAMYITQHRWVTAQPALSAGSNDMVDTWWSGRDRTDIMRFAINGTSIKYTGKGTVDGTPINQYSMDEHNGYFRIATTDWTEGTYVTVLDASNMQTVGRTEPLAPGEQMFSARFMGDMGYVVTFLNVDPLFTIDLSDPYNPKMLGELKIPGFSQYLHPVGDGLLLGIGRDTQEIFTRDANGVETVIGFNDTGMRATLFDVRNPFDPKEIDVLLLGEGWTEVSYNPRALMVDNSRNLYGFISETWNFNNNRGPQINAVLLRVENERLALAQTIDLGTHANWGVHGSRLCFIGNSLYYVHGSGVVVYDYYSFDEIGGIRF